MPRKPPPPDRRAAAHAVRNVKDARVRAWLLKLLSAGSVPAEGLPRPGRGAKGAGVVRCPTPTSG
jgi:hypothetical protein